LQEKKYDVVVVGAGPAGSTAAYAAVVNGAKVLMVDRRRELGVPVQCGEALAEDILKELKIKPDPVWALNRTNAVKIFAPSGIDIRIAERVGGKVGFILNRKIFDKFLALRAVEAGSDLMVGTYVDGLIVENGKPKGVKAIGPNGRLEIPAQVIIAADGVGSRVAKWVGLNSTLKLGDIESGIQFQMVGVDFDSQDTMEFYLGSRISPGGYAWVFPKGEHMANVGLGVVGSRVDRRPLDYLRDFVASKPNLSKGKVVEINGGGDPVSGPLKKTVKDNVILVGDAARQVNAITGGGIDSAMRAGDIAGEVAAKAVKDGDTSEKRLNEYDKRWREKMGKRLDKYLKAKNVFLSLSDKELDELAETLSKVKFDKISVMGMIRVLVKKHPKLLWKLKGLF
jgi:digeranylgeranylglycerophospholipid reductase